MVDFQLESAVASMLRNFPAPRFSVFLHGHADPQSRRERHVSAEFPFPVLNPVEPTLGRPWKPILLAKNTGWSRKRWFRRDGESWIVERFPKFVLI